MEPGKAFCTHSTCWLSKHRLVSKEPFIHHGELVVLFTEEEEEELISEPYKSTLVGKFYHRMPSTIKVRNSF